MNLFFLKKAFFGGGARGGEGVNANQETGMFSAIGKKLLDSLPQH